MAITVDSGAAGAGGGGPGAAVERVEYASGIDGLRDWALIEKPSAPGPGARAVAEGTWIAFVHGHGSTGDQLYTRKDIAERWGGEFRARGLGIVSVNLRGNAWMGPAAAADLRALLRWVRQQYGARRFIFYSGSMGGSSNLAYAALHPDDVAACVGLGVATDIGSYWRWCRERYTGVVAEIADAIEAAYGGTPDARPEVYRRHSALAQAARLTMPVFIAHGEADALIPVEQSRELAKALLARNAQATYREIPDGNHDSPLQLPPVGLILDWVAERVR